MLGALGLPSAWRRKTRLNPHCQLGVLYSHLYGLGRQDSDYIMETVPIVRRRDQQPSGWYPTKGLILQDYNAHAAGNMEALAQG